MTREEAREALSVLKIYDAQWLREAVDMAIEALSAEAVYGEWLQREIIDDDTECGVNDDAAECSVCGYIFHSYYWAKTYFDFCPNCGARMKGGEEE